MTPGRRASIPDTYRPGEGGRGLVEPPPSMALSSAINVASAARMRRNVLTGMLAAGGNTALTLASYPLLLRYLGYELYGVWLVLTTVLTLLQLGQFGIAHAVAKLTAEAAASEDEEAFTSYTTAATLILAGVGAVAVFAVTVLQHKLALFFSVPPHQVATAERLMPWVAIVSAYALVIQVESGALAGVGRSDLAHYALASNRTITLVLSLVAVLLGQGLTGLLMASALGYLAMHAVLLWCLHRHARCRTFRLATLKRSRVAVLVRFAAGSFGSAALSMVFHPANRLLVARFGGVASLPLLEIAYAGAMQVRALFEMALRTLMPEFSRILAGVSDDPTRELRRVLSRAHLFVAVVAGAVFGVIILASSQLLAFWLSNDFRPNLVPVFQLMALGAFASLCGVPSFYLAMGAARLRILFVSSLVQLVVSVASSGVFVLVTGTLSVEQTAMATLFGFVVSSIYLVGWQRAFVRSHI